MTQVHLYTRPKRKPPELGDLKVVNGVEYVRIFKRSSSGQIVVSNGKVRYEWKAVSELKPWEVPSILKKGSEA